MPQKQQAVTKAPSSVRVTAAASKQARTSNELPSNSLLVRTEPNIYSSRKDGGFGASVSVDGAIMAVGATLGAYVYQRNGVTWEKIKRVSPNPVADFFVADAIEVSRNKIIYGRTTDPRNEVRGGNTSYVTIESVSNGTTTTEATLRDDGDSYTEDFARYVSIDGSIAIASGNTDSGAEINIFSDSDGTWKFTGSIDVDALFEPQIQGTYRISALSVKGDRIAFESGAFPSRAGVVVVLKRSGNMWLKEFEAETSCEKCMAFRSNLIVIGQKVYRYNGTVWALEQILASGDGSVTTDGINIAFASGETYRFSGRRWINTDRLESTGQKIGTSEGWIVQSGNGQVLISALTNSTWGITQEIVADNGTNFGRFGSSVALVGDTAVVGAPYDFRLRGNVYVEQNIAGQWHETARISPSVDEDLNEFGLKVAFSGTYIAANSRPDCFFNFNSPQSIYIFRKSGDSWIEDARLISQNTTSGDPCSYEFGSSISLSGTTLAIATADALLIYERNRSSWSETTRISRSQLGFTEGPIFTEARFRINDVKISNDTLAISTQGLDAVENKVRYSVEIYSRSGQRFTFQQRVQIAARASLSLSGDRLAIYGQDFASIYRRSAAVWTKAFDVPANSASNAIAKLELSGGLAAALRSTGVLELYTASSNGYELRNRLENVSQSREATSLSVSGDRFVIGDTSNSDFATAAGAVTPYRIESDFGDAPDSFKTTRVNGGARHFLGGPRLGSLVDADLDGNPSPNASGDDNLLTDDEDSVQFSNLAQGAGSQLNVSVTELGGIVDAWVDFNRDQLFSASERVVANAPAPVGTSVYTFNTPPNAVIGQSYARVRISTNGTQASSGTVTDGEVEDVSVSILPLSVSVSSILVPEGNSGETDAAFHLKLNAPPQSTIAVQAQTVNGSATSNSDYRPFNGTVEFKAGESEKTVLIKVIGDRDIEQDETFDLVISSSSPSVRITNSRATAAILNDDQPSAVPDIRANVSEFNFGSVRVGATSPSRALVVSSTGTAPLEIRSIRINGDFSGTSECPRVLNPGLSCRLVGSFRPTAVGQRTGSVVISTNAPRSPTVVSLRGTGTSANR